MSRTKIQIYRDSLKAIEVAKEAAKNAKPSGMTNRLYHCSINDDGQVILNCKVMRPLGDAKLPVVWPEEPTLVLGGAELDSMRDVVKWLDDTFYGVNLKLNAELEASRRDMSAIKKDLKSEAPIMVQVIQMLSAMSHEKEGPIETLTRLVKAIETLNDEKMALNDRVLHLESELEDANAPRPGELTKP